jgi:uncharacterized LabA/DUF88 family protein
LTSSDKALIDHLFLPGERTCLFVDGANFGATLRYLEWDIDYGNLREVFASRSHMIAAYFYTAMKTGVKDDPMVRFVEWLARHGYRTITKPMKYTGPDGEVRGDMDVEMVVDMVRMSDFIDHLIVCTGDDDFRYAIRHLQERGKRVTIVSTEKASVQILAAELVKQADAFIDVDDLRSELERKPPRVRATS